MKKFLTPKDLEKLQKVKGEVIKKSNGLFMIKQKSDMIEPNSYVFTVWYPEQGLKILSTMDKKEADKKFQEYEKQEPLQCGSCHGTDFSQCKPTCF